MARIRLMLVDDHQVYRAGLRKVFEGQDNFVVVGDTSGVEKATALLHRLRPDIVLVSMELPGQGGLQVCRHIRSKYPHMRVLLLSSFLDEETLMMSIRAGANGFAMKKITGEALIRITQTIASGNFVADSTWADSIAGQGRVQPSSANAHQAVTEFPPQQRRVLALLAEGKTNREIAESLNLSERTVIGYVRIIFRKLNLTRRSQAAVCFAKSTLPTLRENAMNYGPSSSRAIIFPDVR